MMIERVYKFCPKCGKSNLTIRQRMCECKHCGLILYIDPAPCNAVLITNTEGDILLVKRKFPPKEGQWDVPGGFIENSETVEESIVRELQEEIGIKVENLHYFASAHDTYTFKGITKQTIGFIFTAQVKEYEIIIGDDVDSAKWFAPKSVLEQKIAFSSIRKILTQYISSLPSH